MTDDHWPCRKKEWREWSLHYNDADLGEKFEASEGKVASATTDPTRFIPWGSSLFGLTNSVTVLCKPQPLGGRYLIFPMLKTKHWATFLLAGVVPYNLLLSSYNCLVLVVPMINCSDPDCWRRRIRGSPFKAFAWVERPKNTNYFHIPSIRPGLESCLFGLCIFPNRTFSKAQITTKAWQDHSKIGGKIRRNICTI